MDTLETKKAEIRKRCVENVLIARTHGQQYVERFIDEALDSYRDAVVGEIGENTGVNAIPETNDYANGWNDCRKACRKARSDALQALKSNTQ